MSVETRVSAVPERIPAAQLAAINLEKTMQLSNRRELLSLLADGDADAAWNLLLKEAGERLESLPDDVVPLMEGKSVAHAEEIIRAAMVKALDGFGT